MILSTEEIAKMLIAVYEKEYKDKRHEPTVGEIYLSVTNTISLFKTVFGDAVILPKAEEILWVMKTLLERKVSSFVN
jgi:hypothetical protein